MLVKPKALKRGDVVGIVCPASPPFEPGHIEFTYQWLKKLGLKYKLGKHVFDSFSEFAGIDEARIEDFHAMWADPEVKAVLPLRGGNGSVRLLPKLDFELIRRTPKILVGYSDITGLLIPIHQQTGLVTFHGPTLGSFFDDPYTFQHYRQALFEPRPIGLVTDPVREKIWNAAYPPARLVIAEGTGRGPLTGGCLTLIRHLMGPPFEIETAGRMLFLEDLNEEPHDVDRMLLQLLLAGKLKQCTGIIIAECLNCLPGTTNHEQLKLNYSTENVLRQHLSQLGIPVVYGMKIGHSKQKLTLPLGVMASLTATRDSVLFKIEESATT